MRETAAEIRRGSVALLAAVLATPVAIASQAESHVGPVTGLAIAGGRIISSSAAGVFERVDLDAPDRRIGEPEFRVFALDARSRPRPASQPARPGSTAVSDRGSAAAEIVIAVAGGTPGESGWVATLRGDGTVVHSRRVADDLCYAVALSPRGDGLAVAGADGRLLFAPDDLSETREIARHTRAVRALAFSRSASTIYSGSLNGIVRRTDWPDATGPSIRFREQTAAVHSLAVFNETLVELGPAAEDRDSADGLAQATPFWASGATDGRVRLYRGEKLERTYAKLGSAVWALAAAAPGKPDGTAYVLAGTRAGDVWRLETTEHRATKIHSTNGDAIDSLLVLSSGDVICGTLGRLEVVPRAATPHDPPASSSPRPPQSEDHP